MTSYVASGVSIPIGAVSRQGSSLYDANKQRRRFPMWRIWNRLSKLQRYLICCGFAFVVLIVIARWSSAAAVNEKESILLLSRGNKAKIHGDPVEVEEPANKQRVKENQEILLGKKSPFFKFFSFFLFSFLRIAAKLSFFPKKLAFLAVLKSLHRSINQSINQSITRSSTRLRKVLVTTVF
jgi:hypothetical protein